MAIPPDNRVRADSLKRELDTGIVLARLAIEESSGTPKTSDRAGENAKQAYSTFMRFLPMVQAYFTLSERIEIDRKRAELERLIASLSNGGRV